MLSDALAAQLKALYSYTHAMPARFQVEDTFKIASRRVFVAHGKVLAGTVRRGQHVVVPPGLSAPVDAVESVLLSATEGRANVALCFRYNTEEDLAQWRSLGLIGQTLELTDGVAG
jgi:translation elongation factor EF-Tu-like GTPase